MKNDNERAMISAAPVAQAALDTGAAGLAAIVDAWAANFDLDKLAAGLAHVSIAEKRAEQIVAFAKAVFLEGIYRDVLRSEPTVSTTNATQINPKPIQRPTGMGSWPTTTPHTICNAGFR